MKKGFTLRELLILIVMIVALAAIIAPTCVLASPVVKDTGQTTAIVSDQSIGTSSSPAQVSPKLEMAANPGTTIIMKTSRTDPAEDHSPSAMEAAPIFMLLARAHITGASYSS